MEKVQMVSPQRQQKTQVQETENILEHGKSNFLPESNYKHHQKVFKM